VALIEASSLDITISSIPERHARKYFTELEGDRFNPRQNMGGNERCGSKCAKCGELARPAGLEPATPGLEGQCSIQLSYGRVVGWRLNCNSPA
jgi:hypothetical protein